MNKIEILFFVCIEGWRQLTSWFRGEPLLWRVNCRMVACRRMSKTGNETFLDNFILDSRRNSKRPFQKCGLIKLPIYDHLRSPRLYLASPPDLRSPPGFSQEKNYRMSNLREQRRDHGPNFFHHTSIHGNKQH